METNSAGRMPAATDPLWGDPKAVFAWLALQGRYYNEQHHLSISRVQWIAMDSNNAWFGYKEKPRLGKSEWGGSTGPTLYLGLGSFACPFSWIDTLRAVKP